MPELVFCSHTRSPVFASKARNILSLVPRPELGFVKAGEIRGTVVTFKVGTEQVEMASPVVASFGDAPYALWVLHDAEWEPTSDNQKRSLLSGSISVRELAALTRK